MRRRGPERSSQDCSQDARYPIRFYEMEDQKACTLTFCDGTHYDLSSLASASGDYETVIGNSTYKLNVCRGVVSEVYNLDDPDSIGGFMNKTSGDFSLGQVDLSSSPPSVGFELTEV